MCNCEIPLRRIDCFFFAKLYDNQRPIARESYQLTTLHWRHVFCRF